ncbi:MAG: hypothetical protein ACK555_20375 [Acidobacteriota bacterium]
MEVREFTEGFNGDEVGIGGLGAREKFVFFVGPDQLAGFGRAIDQIGEKAGFAGFEGFGAEQEGAGGIEAILAFVGIGADEAKLDLAAAAEAVGEVLGEAAVRGDLPDVIAVGEQNGAAVAGPDGRRVGVGPGGSIVVFVMEGEVDAGGEVGFLAG